MGSIMLMVVLGTVYDLYKRFKYMKLLATSSALHSSTNSENENQREEIDSEKLYILRVSRKKNLIKKKNQLDNFVGQSSTCLLFKNLVVAVCR